MNEQNEQNQTECIGSGDNDLLFTDNVVKYDGNNIKEKALAMFGAFVVTGLIVAVSTLNWESVADGQNVANVSASEEVASKIIESSPKPPKSANPFDSLSLVANSAIVYDVKKDKILYGLNEEKKLPLASVTKLMTALLTVETVDENSNVAISSFALDTEGDSGLLLNETWKIKDLLDFTLMTSSNDGADMLASVVGSYLTPNSKDVPEYQRVDNFIKKMNVRAKEIGMNNTKYMSATGLDEPRGGAIGTAEDISKLLAYIWKNKPSIISHTSKYEEDFVSEDGFLHHAENTNKYVNEIPGLLGSKTGYTDLAGGNLAIIYDSGMDHPIVIVVLDSTIDDRFADVKKLVDATYEYISSGWYEYDIKIAGSTQSI